MENKSSLPKWIINNFICTLLSLVLVYTYFDLNPPQQTVIHTIDKIEITKEIKTSGLIEKEILLKGLKATVKLEAHNGRQASGVLISSEKIDKTDYYSNYILTCNHFTGNDFLFTAEQCRYFKNKTVVNKIKYENVELIATNEFLDISILQFKTKTKLETISVMKPTEENEITLCDPIFTCGCPLGSDPFITTGFVSSFSSRRGILQVSTPVIFGNSGGPIFSLNGKVIGIVQSVQTFSEYGMNGVYPQISFAATSRSINAFMRMSQLGFILGYKDGSSEEKLNKRMASEQDQRFEDLLKDMGLDLK